MDYHTTRVYTFTTLSQNSNPTDHVESRGKSTGTRLQKLFLLPFLQWDIVYLEWIKLVHIIIFWKNIPRTVVIEMANWLDAISTQVSVVVFYYLKWDGTCLSLSVGVISIRAIECWRGEERRGEGACGPMPMPMQIRNFVAKHTRVISVVQVREMWSVKRL